MLHPELYYLLFLLIFLINVIPAFMPPTWVVLAFIYVQYHTAFLPTLVLGVIAATSGRVVLALIARVWFRRFFPERFLANYEHLGNYLKKNQKLTIPVVLGYAFSPLSSNSLFIVAGLSGLRISVVAFSFFIGRIFTYAFWITTSRHLATRLDRIFAGSFSSVEALLNVAVSLLIILIIGHINWHKFLKIKKK